MFGFGRNAGYKELAASELEDLLASGSAMVVDVREPGEFAAEHIEGAVNMPLSRFDPDRLPRDKEKTVVLQCRSGTRSRMALGKCGGAQAAIDTHLAGGIEAWKRAGLPVVRG